VTAETTGVIVIGWQQLALAAGLMLLTGGLTVALKLGVARQLAIATARTYVQLLLLGLVL
jgi:putative ABC transport system permease protein